MVSRVLNNSGYVAQEKRERVLQVVKELNYKPHPVAVSLKNAKTHQILYYVRDLSNIYYMEMYKGMVEYSSQRGYNFLISGHLDFQQINSLMVDGVLLPTESYTTQENLDQIRVPVLAAAYKSPVNPSVPHVDADVETAMTQAVAHLKALGHSRIAYLSMNRCWVNDPRQKCFFRSTVDFWGPGELAPMFGPEYEAEPDYDVNYYEVGILCARQFLESTCGATAVVCFNDDMAIGFMGHLQGLGVRIPADLSVIGIDGHFGGQYCFPPLTTVSIEPHRHGVECARGLIDLIEGRESQALGVVPCRLIVRQSTAAL